MSSSRNGGSFGRRLARIEAGFGMGVPEPRRSRHVWIETSEDPPAIHRGEGMHGLRLTVPREYLYDPVAGLSDEQRAELQSDDFLIIVGMHPACEPGPDYGPVLPPGDKSPDPRPPGPRPKHW